MQLTGWSYYGATLCCIRHSFRCLFFYFFGSCCNIVVYQTVAVGVIKSVEKAALDGKMTKSAKKVAAK